MTRPTKHPKSGVYRVRVAIPAALRDITERRYGKRVEFIESLSTKDPAAAKRLALPVVEKFQGWLAAAQAEHEDRPQTLTDREVSALCGRWLALKQAEHRDEVPQSWSNFETEIDYLGDILAGLDGSPEHPNPVKDALEVMHDHGMEAMLTVEGLHIDQESRERLACYLIPLFRQHLMDLAERRSTGRWRESVKPAEFAEYQPRRPVAHPKAGTTLDALLGRWALDHGYSLTTKPVARPLYDRLRTIERLATFLGHRDASRVTKAVAVAWKGEMQRAGLHASTIRNDLSEMSAVWKCGLVNGLLAEHGNPFAGISPPKAVKKKQAKRAFTDEEAAAIIAAARLEKGYLRWLPLVLCMTGARLNEVCQATKADMQTVDGVHVLRIHDEGEERSVKNADSRRSVPIHPALVAEGFLEHIAALPARSSLWPDLAPDGTFGRKGNTASRHIGRWLRRLGIADPALSPSHSWRHWFIEACRRVVMPPEVRSALTGHSAKLDESAGYGEGMGTMLQVMARHMETVRAPWEGR